MGTDPRFWDRLAPKYASMPVARPGAFDRKIEHVRARMGPGSVVLDIGCGTGSLALRLAEAGAEVHGLDVSKEMIRIAEEKAKGAVKFHVGGFDESFDGFGPGTLDGVCAFSLLHLIEDRPAALRRIFDLLRPGGFFAASTLCLADSWVPYSPLLWFLRQIGRAPWVGLVSKRGLDAEIEAAGFTALTAPDVGAQPTVHFTLADKPK